ncbi:MAG TPA: hypothetical protein PLY93_10240, partial [Turneriella sp.]|nr:hypothetical protein [Turneriella sp.]
MPKLIAVVYKNSALENYSTKQIRRHRELNPHLSAQMVQAHEEHAASLDALHRIVDTLQLKTEFFERDRLRQNLDNFALVISLGGDGTFIHASHYIKNVSSNQTLLVGINSSPKHSVGHYCRFHLLAKKNENQFAAMLAAFFNEKNPSWKENFLLRMRVTVQGQEVAYPILNDVLFCEKEAGSTSRYTL